MLAPILVTAPADLAVSVEEVKQHLRVEDGGDDNLIEGLIKAATNHVQQRLGQALVTQTWRQDFRCFHNLKLRPGPVDADSVVVTYRDAENVEQTLADTVYWIGRDAEGTYLDLKYSQSWPTVYSRPDAISVTFDAGSAVDDVPQDIKLAIIMHVAFLYEHRETHIDNSVVPSGAYDLLLRPYWRPQI